MTRSIWKGKYSCFSHYNLNNSHINLSVTKLSDLSTDKRDSVFLPSLLGKVISIHNGKQWFKVKVRDNILFNKFGQYSWPKKLCIYKNKKKKKKK